MVLNISSYVLEYKHCSAVGLKESMRLKSLRDIDRNVEIVGINRCIQG
jgi:hypothetical protein